MKRLSRIFEYLPKPFSAKRNDRLVFQFFVFCTNLGFVVGHTTHDAVYQARFVWLFALNCFTCGAAATFFFVTVLDKRK